mmetsp:Transcript_9743/g.27859  ORF Transcript_9743/g.27859 Transcript_9743/m.27859 type:complete len:148 (-) Transcript_9743:88-531(-)|eukprot:CAMPEP_0117669102 /NCGR_PEP_ID=MMETSP0804-20121206/11929_1 /TAXON_ID=1074897 /ORGANISM="Tetraselmis astigmatica, Strain CCMP880" /LENGTH=147 /DNA_ID=CAMNT_0005477089 /DNA_START=208 /DNA_END=651 /DNA_ORIENTATION=+
MPTTSSTRKTKKFTNSLDAKAEMEQISGGLTGTLENFHRAEKEAKEELRKDAEGLHEVENALYKLHKRKAALEESIASGKAWLEHYETNIAPFEGQYDKMVAGIGEIYVNAKVGHEKGVELLKKEFNYHPAYKHHSDKFTATPFKPM